MLERDPKRRRLAPVNAPFRSPLRRPSTPTSQSQSDASSLPSSSSTANTTPQRPRLPRQFKSPVFARNDERGVSPEVLALIHQKRDLEAAIKAEMKAIETAELALKYEKQGEDDNLEKLVVKWRRCAQRAAEQVFVTSRNRIDQMGGLREFMKSQRRTSSWNDDPPQPTSQTETYDVETYDEGAGKEEDLGDEFTMEIMLKMAGVEEKLIGWDRELNNFIKEG